MNILIENITAILPDESKVCSVYVKDGIIAGIDEIPENFKADKVINGSGKLLTPGFVNAHTHTYMTVFRNSADDLPFYDWLFGRILPMEDNLTEEDCYWGTLLAMAEMIKSGTTAFMDMYIMTNAAPRAAAETGVKCVLTRGLTGNCDEESGGFRRVREATAEMEAWKHVENVHFALAPHAPYTCTENYMKYLAEEAKRLDVGINIHLSESLSEMDDIKKQYGCTPIELADRCGLLTERTVADHCVQATDSDIALMAERKTSVASCPISNLKLANGVAPIKKMLDAGVNVALGTDGAASNNALNMIRELSYLTLLQKGILGDPCAVTAKQGIQMATRNGALALGFKNTGEIKKGYAADLCIIDTDRPNMRPIFSPEAALCYSANGSEVETVMIDGKIVMEKGILLNIDTERVIYECDKISGRLTK